MSFYFDDIFTIPVIRNPFADLLDMRRQMLELFDSHIPQQQQEPQQQMIKEGEKEKEKEGVKEDANTSIKKVEEKQEPMIRWNPRCDVEEAEGELMIRAELPGLKKEEVKIEYDEKHGILSIFGEKKQEKEEKKDTSEGKYHYVERRYGSFKRSFRLPEACRSKVDEITAKSVDGVLEIRCPKENIEPKPETKKNIEIK
jgi:HSP20 family protein